MNLLTQTLLSQDIPARSGSCITSLTSDQVAGNIFVAGFGDGAVRVFDQRLKPTTSMVKVWREHKQWITNVHMQRGGLRELISGSRNGEIRLWDLRMNGALSTISATKDTLRTLSVHEHAPVFSMYVSCYSPCSQFLLTNFFAIGVPTATK
jgi:regulator-associated protein of mTOR